jgi:nondiscriminating glutamyl-tRNA synthetase
MGSVRVRFAPSPTGLLHVGGARTALFNWLFARHQGGSFILRIEDTDVERSEARLEEELLRDLAWLGLAWDEGPERGGAFAPYRQSERLHIYRERAERLVAEGKAYPCFCTDEELEGAKAARLAAGLPPRYEGTCRSLSDAERGGRRAEGRPESIRFAVRAEERRLNDVVRGEVTFPAGMVGDFVLMRSNGLPTYNFAATIDDALMEITHVIRGEEHLPNTVRQLMIYEALGLRLPLFAHIPLILGPDRSKLSKRHGAPNVADYRERGYPPEAVINYLAFLGWSPPGPGEILETDALVRDFTLERVSPSPSVFDEGKLDWVSAQHVRAGGSARYFEDAVRYFPEEVRTGYPRERLREIFDVLAENLPCFSRIEDAVGPFRHGPPALSEEAKDAVAGAGALLAALRDALDGCTAWKAESIGACIKAAGASLNVKGRALYMPLRAAMTGVMHGPDLAKILEIRGKTDTIDCLRSALTALSQTD